MPRYSALSLDRLFTCDVDLQRLFFRVIEVFDCSVLCGSRGEAEQNAAFHAGASKIPWPKSRHNARPAEAVDVAPYNDKKLPIDWEDTRRFYLFSGYVLGIAAEMGIPITWGGDWNRNTRVKDQEFNDLVHFELFKGGR